jgi:nucleoside-diphosphate-sugar epimerase
MKIFITGGTGFVGSHLVRRSVQDGHEVHVLLRPSSRTWRIDDVLSRVKKHVADLADHEVLKKIMTEVRPDGIFHLATHNIYGAQNTQGSDNDIIKTNFLGTVNLLQAAENIPYSCFVNTGSPAEYGVRREPIPMKETDSCEPVHSYGATKCAATIFGHYFAKTRKKPIVTLRLFLPYGPFSDAKRLIPHAILSALQNRALNLGSAKTARDYVYIDDVIDAYMACLTKAQKHEGEIFNIGGGRQYTLEDTARIILEKMGASIPVSWNTKPAAEWDSEFYEADITKAKEMLGWQPKYTFEEGIEKTIAWFREHSDMYKE